MGNPTGLKPEPNPVFKWFGNSPVMNQLIGSNSLMS